MVLVREIQRDEWMELGVKKHTHTIKTEDPTLA